LLSLQIGNSQEWAIYFSATDIDCVSNTTCYNVLIKSTGEDFEIGSTNLRLFYNANTQRFSEENAAVSLHKSYRITNRNITSQIASLPGKGSLEFEHNMGMLNIPIDFLGTGNAMNVSAFNFTAIASNICFQSVDKAAMKNPADFVWVTEQTKEEYTSAYTTINNPAGNTTNLKGSNHEIETGVELRSDCGGSNALLSNVSNYPNPFVEQTRISYSVQHETQVDLTVYGFDGKLIYENSVLKRPGSHYFEVSKEDLDGAGVYFYTVNTQNNSIRNRMILIK